MQFFLNDYSQFFGFLAYCELAFICNIWHVLLAAPLTMQVLRNVINIFLKMDQNNFLVEMLNLFDKFYRPIAAILYFIFS